MSQAIRIAGQKRDARGRNAVKHLRAKGQVPGILYGHKQDALAITVEARKLEDALKHHVHFLELEVDGKVETALLQDLQYDVFGQQILHADFLRVDADEPVDVPVGIELRGHPKGASEGGVLQRFLDEVKLRCPPRLIPDILEIDVSALLVHESLLLKDLKLPEGVALADDPQKAICAVVTQKLVEAAPVGEEPAAPEVIGEKKPEATPEET